MFCLLFLASILDERLIRKKENKFEFMCQNVRGIKSNGRIEKLIEELSTRKSIAACIQAKCWHGKDLLQNSRYTLISFGLNLHSNL